jgi:dCTP deaminase
MILTYDQIIEAQEQHGIGIDPWDPEQLQPASYDLRVGAQGAVTSNKSGLINIEEKGFLTIEPGDFGIIITHEILTLSNQYAARFGLRSGLARQGLIATTGPQIDPGYTGRLILGLTNLTPKAIVLSYLDDIVSVEFHRLTAPTSHPYQGKYQGKTSLGRDEIEFIINRESMALSEVLTTLRTLTSDVASLNTSVENVASQVKSFTNTVSTQVNQVSGQVKTFFAITIGIVSLGVAIMTGIAAFIAWLASHVTGH